MNGNIMATSCCPPPQYCIWWVRMRKADRRQRNDDDANDSLVNQSGPLCMCIWARCYAWTIFNFNANTRGRHMFSFWTNEILAPDTCISFSSQLTQIKINSEFILICAFFLLLLETERGKDEKKTGRKIFLWCFGWFAHIVRSYIQCWGVYSESFGRTNKKELKFIRFWLFFFSPFLPLSFLFILCPVPARPFVCAPPFFTWFLLHNVAGNLFRVNYWCVCVLLCVLLGMTIWRMYFCLPVHPSCHLQINCTIKIWLKREPMRKGTCDKFGPTFFISVFFLLPFFPFSYPVFVLVLGSGGKLLLPFHRNKNPFNFNVRFIRRRKHKHAIIGITIIPS